MACGGKELVSLFCNPKSSDYKIEEQIEEVEELETEAQHERLKTLLHIEEAEVKRLKANLENNSGPWKQKNETANEEFYLPSDLVRLILSRLALKDNIRSSVVCKTWCETAASVRVRARPCWLMYLDSYQLNGVSYGFYDPVEMKKTKEMNLPELSKYSRILCSKDGWLLMIDSYPRWIIFFFNPFTRERIDLPRLFFHEINCAFSCAPTKNGCLVFCINETSRAITISTWRPGATTWVKENFPNPFSSYIRPIGNILYSDDGLFYVASKIALWVFDPSARTWNVLPEKPETGALRWMTEYQGQIFLVDASSLEPLVFRLNRSEWVWEKKETLDGSSIFVSDGLCVMTSGLTGSMSNILYFWNLDINERRPTKYQRSFICNQPYKYSLYSRRFCEDIDGYYFEYRTQTSMDGVWIEPPHNISIFDYSIQGPSDQGGNFSELSA